MTTPTPPNSRRSFLKGIGYAAILPAATGMVSNTASADSKSDKFKFKHKFNKRGDSRAKNDLLIRQSAASVNYRLSNAVQTPNQDELIYSGKIANFSKCLPHNDLGEVDSNAYQQLLTAIDSAQAADYEAIPLGGTAKLANPQAAEAFQLEGLDSHAFELPAFPEFASQQLAGEMVELYWHALTHEVPFSQYGLEPQTQAAVRELARFPGYAGVNAGTLFRGHLPGDANGPLISQFLWLDIPVGAMNLPQRCKLPIAGDVHMTAYDEWLAIQRGAAPTRSTTYNPTPHYIRNAHDMAEWVHQDYSFQAFHNAALILMGMKAQRDSHPYSSSKTQNPFITFGGPHILDMIAKACYAALKACWYQKWQVHRTLRPEMLGGRVHNHLQGAASYPLHNSLLNATAVSETFSRHGSYLLPQVFPEGSPTHPSYPAGHAAIAGACVTVLKAFFDESFTLPAPVSASDDGLNLLPYNQSALTVGGELNKLAGNIALGRDYAGVHYRQDGLQGLALGEKVALHLLLESKALCNEPGVSFKLTQFNNETVTF